MPKPAAAAAAAAVTRRERVHAVYPHVAAVGIWRPLKLWGLDGGCGCGVVLCNQQVHSGDVSAQAVDHVGRGADGFVL